MSTGRPKLRIVLIGHVDAGKSTLAGRMLVDGGAVDARTLEKHVAAARTAGHEKQYLTYLTDTDEAERERGVTIDVGMAEFSTGVTDVEIVDAPGHRDYTVNMIRGLENVDVAVLVVSARRGEFEDGWPRDTDAHIGTSREHLILARAMGVRNLVVFVNKMDDPTVNWDAGRFSEITRIITEFVRVSGFSRARFVVLPGSAATGDGVLRASRCGDALFGTLDKMARMPSEPAVADAVPPATKFSASITIMATTAVAPVVSRGFRGVLHSDGVEVDIEVVRLSKNTCTRPFLRRGESGNVVFHTDTAVKLRPKTAFTIRTSDTTVAVGVICAKPV